MQKNQLSKSIKNTSTLALVLPVLAIGSILSFVSLANAQESTTTSTSTHASNSVSTSTSTSTPALPDVPPVKTVSEKAPLSLGFANLAYLKKTGKKALDERIASLYKWVGTDSVTGTSTATSTATTTGMLDRLKNNKKLTDLQVITLKGEINAKIVELKEHRDALEAISDSSTTARDDAKKLVQEIYTKFRIYSIFNVKNSLRLNLLQEKNRLDEIQKSIGEHQARTDALKTGSKAATSTPAMTLTERKAKEQAKIDNAKALLAGLSEKIDDLIGKSYALVPEDYPVKSREVVTEVNTGAKEIRATIKQIWNVLNGK